MSERDRPYSGQMQTVGGERGKQLVSGLTMRDIADCYVMGVLDSSSHLNLGCYYDRCQEGAWEWNDLYRLEDLNQLDPIAIPQNMCCRIEKMMGIYPNVPKLTQVDCSEKYLIIDEETLA